MNTKYKISLLLALGLLANKGVRADLSNEHDALVRKMQKDSGEAYGIHQMGKISDIIKGFESYNRVLVPILDANDAIDENKADLIKLSDNWKTQDMRKTFGAARKAKKEVEKFYENIDSAIDGVIKKIATQETGVTLTDAAQQTELAQLKVWIANIKLPTPNAAAVATIIANETQKIEKKLTNVSDFALLRAEVAVAGAADSNKKVLQNTAATTILINGLKKFADECLDIMDGNVMRVGNDVLDQLNKSTKQKKALKNIFDKTNVVDAAGGLGYLSSLAKDSERKLFKRAMDTLETTNIANTAGAQAAVFTMLQPLSGIQTGAQNSAKIKFAAGSDLATADLVTSAELKYAFPTLDAITIDALYPGGGAPAVSPEAKKAFTKLFRDLIDGFEKVDAPQKNPYTSSAPRDDFYLLEDKDSAETMTSYSIRKYLEKIEKSRASTLSQDTLKNVVDTLTGLYKDFENEAGNAIASARINRSGRSDSKFNLYRGSDVNDIMETKGDIAKRFEKVITLYKGALGSTGPVTGEPVSTVIDNTDAKTKKPGTKTESVSEKADELESKIYDLVSADAEWDKYITKGQFSTQKAKGLLDEVIKTLKDGVKNKAERKDIDIIITQAANEIAEKAQEAIDIEDGGYKSSPAHQEKMAKRINEIITNSVYPPKKVASMVSKGAANRRARAGSGGRRGLRNARVANKGREKSIRGKSRGARGRGRARAARGKVRVARNDAAPRAQSNTASDNDLI